MDVSSLQGLGRVGQLNSDARLEGALEAQESAANGDAQLAAAKFEALLATTLVKEMRKALPEGSFFGKASGSDVFNGWMDEHLGRALSESGALDLAGMIRIGIGSKQAENESLEGKRP